MAKNKKLEHKILGVFIKVICPISMHENIIEISNDVTANSQECEICGSHGDVSVMYTCPDCGQWHDHEIKSWYPYFSLFSPLKRFL